MIMYLRTIMEHLMVVIHGLIAIDEIFLICGDEILLQMRIDSDHVRYAIMCQLHMSGVLLKLSSKDCLLDTDEN